MSMMMAYSSSSSVICVCLLLLFPLLFVAAQAEGVFLLGACKTVGGGSTYFDVEFCMEALGSVAGNGTSNYRDLAVISIDLLKANATSTEAKIEGLLHDGGVGKKENTTVAWCLRSCLALYGGIIGRQTDCDAAVKAGRIDEAAASLERSATDAKECEAGFSRSYNAASPLTAEDDNAFRLAKLGVALLRFA